MNYCLLWWFKWNQGDRDTFRVDYLEDGRSDVPDFSDKAYIKNLLTQIFLSDWISECRCVVFNIDNHNYCARSFDAFVPMISSTVGYWVGCEGVAKRFEWRRLGIQDWVRELIWVLDPNSKTHDQVWVSAPLTETPQDRVSQGVHYFLLGLVFSNDNHEILKQVRTPYYKQNTSVDLWWSHCISASCKKIVYF